MMMSEKHSKLLVHDCKNCKYWAKVNKKEHACTVPFASNNDLRCPVFEKKRSKISTSDVFDFVILVLLIVLCIMVGVK